MRFSHPAEGCDLISHLLICQPLPKTVLSFLRALSRACLGITIDVRVLPVIIPVENECGKWWDKVQFGFTHHIRLPVAVDFRWSVRVVRSVSRPPIVDIVPYDVGIPAETLHPLSFRYVCLEPVLANDRFL